MSEATPAEPPAARPLAILAKPWFWVVVIGSLWLLPLIKSLGAELPDPLPGMDSAPVELSGLDEHGERVSLADLSGYLVLAGSLSLAEDAEVGPALERFFGLRKRLRGLGYSLVFLVLVQDADAEALQAFLDGGSLRKPTQVFLLDEQGQALAGLQAAAGGSGPDYFLLDTHGRLRGAYVATVADLDHLVTHAGQLANWRASDPPVAE